jgi:Mrp family chromosome partitioning ATPase
MDPEQFSSIIAGHEEEQNNGNDGKQNDSDSSPRIEKDERLRRTTRPVKVSATVANPLEKSIVAYPLYNSFNYSAFLPKDHEPSKLSLGITSPNYGEGKTTTVCNLAAALSMGSGRRTIIVDLNLARPRIHDIFGTPRGPGLAEALIGEDICVVPTNVDNLFALPIGNRKYVQPGRLAVFREILDSLFREFDFVIVDLPPAGTKSFPTLIANQLSGLLVVVRSGVTKRQDVRRLFRRVREDRVLGFVMNGVRENDF